MTCLASGELGGLPQWWNRTVPIAATPSRGRGGVGALLCWWGGGYEAQAFNQCFPIREGGKWVWLALVWKVRWKGNDQKYLMSFCCNGWSKGLKNLSFCTVAGEMSLNIYTSWPSNLIDGDSRVWPALLPCKSGVSWWWALSCECSMSLVQFQFMHRYIREQWSQQRSGGLLGVSYWLW